MTASGTSSATSSSFTRSRENTRPTAARTSSASIRLASAAVGEIDPGGKGSTAYPSRANPVRAQRAAAT